jgi:LDH2 family malate/lactate/ureidoglycolate dehydrogenase
VAKGGLFLAIDVTRFLPGDEFGSRMDQLIQDVHATEPAAGVDRVCVPGEIEHRTQIARERDGIPLNREVLAELDRLAAELGVESLIPAKEVT